MNSSHRTAGGKGFVRLTILVALAMIVLVPTMARAEILAVSSNVDQVTYSDGVAHILPINGASSTLSFSTTVPNQRVAVLFNAECAVKGTDTWSYLDTDVLIDGVAARPSTSDNAFCTSNGNNTLSNWVSASTNAYRTIPAVGVHKVRVRGTLQNFNAGEQFQVDDISVIVMK